VAEVQEEKIVEAPSHEVRESGSDNVLDNVRVTRRSVLARIGAAGLAVPALSLLPTVAGSASAFQATTEDDGESISARLLSDFDTSDPAVISNTSDHSIAVLLYSGLARYKPGGVEPEPDLATEWTISDDGLIYTFKLREGVKWQKGYGDFTASDVVYSLNRVLDPATASQFAADASVISNIEATDPLTVTITLSRPFASFMSAVIAFRPGWVVNQKAIEEKGENYINDPIGTGPYMWDSRTIGTGVTLKRNPDYYAPVDIETVEFKFVQEDSVAELALQSGDLDIAYLYAPESSDRILNESGDDIEASRIASYRTQWAGFNLSREKMQDIRVRQAIIHAIDKPAAASAVAGDLAQVVSSIFNPNLSAAIDPNPFPYDPEKAKALLTEAGYPDGIDIDVLVIPSSTWPDLITVVQEQWRQVGINANLQIVERAVYDELMTQASTFDLSTVNITRSEPFQYASYFLSSNIPDPNFHHYNNPEVDEIIQAASSELDPAKRDDLWAQFQTKVLVDDVVGFGMTNINYVIAWRSEFANGGNQYVDSYPIWQMTTGS
jgi:peptide/nickel transport system substrate-binding protein